MLVTVSSLIQAVSEPNANTNFVIKAKLEYNEHTKRYGWCVHPRQLQLAGCLWFNKFMREDGMVHCKLMVLQPVSLTDFGREQRRIGKC